jgi:hypothetical protein
MTLSIMTLSMKNLRIKIFSYKTLGMTFIIKALSIKTFSIKAFRITFSMKSLSITTSSIKTPRMTLSKTHLSIMTLRMTLRKTHLSIMTLSILRMRLSIIKLSIITLNMTTPSITIKKCGTQHNIVLNFVMPSAITFSVIPLSVFKPNVLAPIFSGSLKFEIRAEQSFFFFKKVKKDFFIFNCKRAVLRLPGLILFVIF